MNLRFIQLLATIFAVGCTSTRVVGNRGDATLHNTKSFWPMIYPYSVSFAPVTLDYPGRSHFKVHGLREATISRFDIQVQSTKPLVDQSGEYLNKSPLPEAGFKASTIRLVIKDDQGRVAYSKTIQCSEVTWFVESMHKENYRVSYPIGIDCDLLPKADFSVSIEVMAPSKTTGDYIRVSGFGFPHFRQ